MIIVMPNNSMTSAGDFDGYGQYEPVLIPNPDSIHRGQLLRRNRSAESGASRGLSMGGGITFNVGFPNANTFAHI